MTSTLMIDWKLDCLSLNYTRPIYHDASVWSSYMAFHFKKPRFRHRFICGYGTPFPTLYAFDDDSDCNLDVDKHSL